MGSSNASSRTASARTPRACWTTSANARPRAGARHLLGITTVAHLAWERRLLEIAQTVLGGSAIPFRATSFAKTPDADWLVAWHQDTALPFTERFDAPGFGPWSVKEGVDYAHAPTEVLQRVVALRIHLDASTEENGPLRVVPGSHVHGVLEDDEVAELARRSPSVACCVARGGVLVMSPLLVHASSKLGAARPRRVLHLEYADTLELAPGRELRVC
ncbi:MAG: phytanoyl-CoA dioxygenase family protein [Planctomycetota bacterium]